MHIESLRGSVVESRHRVHVAVVDPDGTLVAAAGEPDFVTFMRSVAKPFQALPLVEDGVLHEFGLGTAELALACASHSSEPAQVDLVRGFLAKIGVAERDLRCGPHRPLSDAVAREYETRGVTLTAVHSNCSGKHAGMLALSLHHHWPASLYTLPEHPVQRRCLTEVSRWTGVPEAEVGTATDGCGVVTFAVPLRGMALGYARLAADYAPGRKEPASCALLGAMLQHPELLAGEGRPCTELMWAHRGKVVAKVGAEGVYAGVLLGRRLGIALKVEDGHGPAAALALAAVLEQLGLQPIPPALLSAPITNSRGETVGELRVSGKVSQ